MPNQTKSLLVQLVSGQLPLNPLWQKTSYRMKFLFRSYLAYPETLPWLKKLALYPLLQTFLSQQTNLPAKLQRPYLASNMSRKARYNALCAHYDFISSLPTTLVEHLYAANPIVLAEIIGKDEQPFTITLESNDKYSREGELTLSVFNHEQVNLATLTFAIIKHQQKLTLFIGGLQGSNQENAREQIQKATKACYGIFPKTMAIEAILVIARFLQVEQILAVSNRTHIYNNFRYRRQNKLRMADYDSYWETLQATISDDDFYSLPAKLVRKAMEDIPSKKRSEYRNRYLLLDKLIDDTHQHLVNLTK
ncbi:VirK/YbjX family protein [Utexia brackfieldae]|uniref:VirK/YbjX family protein n=1 Tax=Utexia brackfieldae TaxID=3074108 RepID=UPI00370D9334